MTFEKFLIDFLVENKEKVSGKVLPQIQQILKQSNITASNVVLRRALKKSDIAFRSKPTITDLTLASKLL
jgi:hypothetical protein